MSSLHYKFRRIAIDVRKELQSFVKNGVEYFRGAQPHLGGWCCYASVMVFQALKEKGYNPLIAQGSGHWFTLCDGYLIDITASQFGQPRIVVRKHEVVGRDIISGEKDMSWWRAINFFDGTDNNYNLSQCAVIIATARRQMIDVMNQMPLKLNKV